MDRGRQQTPGPGAGQVGRRDPKALDYGGHWLVHVRASTVVVGGDYGTDLYGITRYLLGEDDES